MTETNNNKQSVTYGEQINYVFITLCSGNTLESIDYGSLNDTFPHNPHFLWKTIKWLIKSLCVNNTCGNLCGKCCLSTLITDCQVISKNSHILDRL